MRVLFHVLIFVSSVCQAFAGNACDVPVTEWKPREMLHDKLEAEGLRVSSITTENGCYRAIAIDKSGKSVSLVFDPRTLDRVGSDEPAKPE